MPRNTPSFFQRWSALKLKTGKLPNDAPVTLPVAHSEQQSLDLDTLRALFRQPEFAARDGLDDYDGDYTAFEPRGEALTCDMRWALERTRPAAGPAPETVVLDETAPALSSAKESTG